MDPPAATASASKSLRLVSQRSSKKLLESVIPKRATTGNVSFNIPSMPETVFDDWLTMAVVVGVSFIVGRLP